MPGGHGTPAGQGLGPKRGGRPSERRSEQSDRRGTLAGRPPREPPCRHGGDVQPRRPAEHRCLRGAEGPLAWAVRTSPLRPRAPRAPLPPAIREHVARARTPGPLLLLPRPPGRSSPGFTFCSHPREASPAGVSLPAPRPALLHTPQRRRGRWRLLPARGTHSSAPGGRGRRWLAPRCTPVSARKRRLAGVCRMEGIGIRVQSVWLSPPSHFKDEKPHVIVEKNQCGSSAGGVQGGVGTSRACEMQMQPERPRPAKELPRPQGRKGGGSLARGAAGRRDGQMMSVQCYPGPLRARGAPVLGPGAAAV